MAQEGDYRPDLKGATKAPFNAAGQYPLDTQVVNNHLKSRIDSMPVPKDFSGNPGEWKSRMAIVGHERLANELLLARQNGKPFDTSAAKKAIDRLPQDVNPIKEQTYAMENGQSPAGNLNDKSMREQRLLDAASTVMTRAEYGEYFNAAGQKNIAASIGGVSQSLAQAKIPAQAAIDYHELATGKTLSAGLKATLIENEKKLTAPAPAPADAQSASPAAASARPDS